MAADPARRIENRRRIIQTLRRLTETHEREAADCRARADRLEAATNALADPEAPLVIADNYVIDRDGLVWLVVRDGGMATRATATGVVSAGIVWLEQVAGPLTPFDAMAYRRTYPRSET